MGQANQKGNKRIAGVVDPGKGYRLLRKGEILRVGDQFWRPSFLNWGETDFPGGMIGSDEGHVNLKRTYRRPITPSERALSKLSA